MSQLPEQHSVCEKPSLILLSAIFLRLGIVAFGGPAAHIAIMEEEFVRRRQWLSREHFLDLVGAANLIPGPNSTEVALHIGYVKRGLSGLVVAGISFILPAAILVTAFSAIYVKYGKLPAVSGILYGLKPVIIVIVVQAVLALARTALKTKTLFVVAVLSATLYAIGVPEVLLLFGAGLLFCTGHFIKDKEHGEKSTLLVIISASIVLIASTQCSIAFLPGETACNPLSLFCYFVKIGSVLYGSGYVLLAFLRNDLVAHYHWISAQQLLDAVAVGQMTPGPVFTAATFVGYITGGIGGAVLSTVGVFLPAFLMVAFTGRFIQKMRRSILAARFIDAVNAVAVALMMVVIFQLGRAAFVNLWTAVMALLAAVILFRYRVNSIWLMLGGAFVGLITH